MYTIYPTQNSIVIAGPTCGAGYSARSQLAARINVLAQNPSATGTARSYDGEAPVMVGHIAGVHLDVERPRPPLPGVQGIDPVTGGTRWTFSDGSYVRADSSLGGGGCVLRDREGYEISWGQELERLIGADHPAMTMSRELTLNARESQLRAGRRLATILRDERKFLG